MNEKYSYRKIWTIAYPILVSLVMEQLIGLTDTAFMGRIGEVELGATAIGGVYFMIIFLAGLGFSVGAQILMARRNGEKDYSAIGSIFYQGLFFLLALAAFFFILSQAFSNQILSMIISSSHILEKAEDYIEWRVYGFFFSFAAAMFRAFYVGTTHTKTLTLNSVVMVLSNFVFNYILVFGKFGVPAFGIAGAAMGSSLSELVSLLFFIFYTRRSIDIRKYGLNRIPGIDFKALRKILNVSVWMMVQNFISVSTWFIFFVYIEHLGERPLAITNIVRNLTGFVFMILVAFSSTCSSLVSNTIGEGRKDEVLGLVRRHIRLAFMVITPLLVVISIIPRIFIAIYTDIPDLITATVPVIWVTCGVILCQIPGNIYFSSVSGSGNTRTAFGLELIALVVYMVYTTVTILIMRVDVTIAWTADGVYGITMYLLSRHYMHSGKWQQRVI